MREDAGQGRRVYRQRVAANGEGNTVVLLQLEGAFDMAVVIK